MSPTTTRLLPSPAVLLFIGSLLTGVLGWLVILHHGIADDADVACLLASATLVITSVMALCAVVPALRALKDVEPPDDEPPRDDQETLH
jgi:hypothetical protein